MVTVTGNQPLNRVSFRSPLPVLRIAGRWVVGEDAGHRLRVTDVAIDHAEEREDGGLAGGDAIESGILCVVGADKTRLGSHAEPEPWFFIPPKRMPFIGAASPGVAPEVTPRAGFCL